ncbi:MAG: hypothetical protein AABZ06_10615 [Bdellovibrionota bacterium]
MSIKRKFQTEEESSLRIRVPAIRLDKSNIRDLWKIIETVGDNRTSTGVFLRVSGNKEHVTTRSIDKLISSRWPKDVNHIELSAENETRAISVELENHPEGTNRIEIYGQDPDWVSARTKEIDEFISSHKSWYWVFHDVTTVMIGSVGFGVLVGFGAQIRFHLPFDGWLPYGMGAMVGGVLFCGYVARPLYPFIDIDSGNQSIKRRMRFWLNWVMATIAGSLLFNALSALWS